MRQALLGDALQPAIAIGLTDFICAKGLDGILRNRHDTNRFAERVEEFQHAAARTEVRIINEVDE